MYLPLAEKLIEKYFEENQVDAEAGTHMCVCVCVCVFSASVTILYMLCVFYFADRFVNMHKHTHTHKHRDSSLHDGISKTRENGKETGSAQRTTWYIDHTTSIHTLYECIHTHT